MPLLHDVSKNFSTSPRYRKYVDSKPKCKNFGEVWSAFGGGEPSKARRPLRNRQSASNTKKGDRSLPEIN